MAAFENDTYHALAEALGWLVIGFNELEVALGGALMRLLKEDDERVGAVFVSVLGFRQKFELCKALSSKIQEPSTRKKFEEMLNQAQEVSESRNRFVHAEYTPVRGDDQTTMAVLHQRLKDFSKESRFGTVKELFRYIKPVNPEEIEILANEASMVGYNILQISERFYDD